MWQFSRSDTDSSGDDSPGELPGTWSTVDLSEDLSEAYDLGGDLGRGGMAEVFLATEKATSEKYALKKMIPGLVCLGRLRSRFENEIDLLARCRSPFVLHCVDHGHWKGTPALVTELCSGSLYDLSKDRPLPLLQTLRYALQILAALDNVHAKGVVHRDIKPSNILIGMDGNIRLADFGISRHPERRLTMPGHRVGTPAYRPPELDHDPRNALPHHDLYALGFLILTLTTHLKPRSLLDPLERARTLKLFPPAVMEAIDRSTRPSPHMRFSSTIDMAVLLGQAIEELEPKKAAPAPEPAPKKSRKRTKKPKQDVVAYG